MKTKSVSNRTIGSAFTLIELLAVIAVIALLAATLLPAMAGTKVRTRITQCMDNQRQMALGWQMYSDDNLGEIMGMGDNLSGWRVRPNNLSWATLPPTTSDQDAALKYDQLGYRVGALYPYAKDQRIIHCPGDPMINRTVGPAYASYTGMGGLNDLTNTANVQHPSERFLWVEENNQRVIVVGPLSRTIGENLGTWAFQSDPVPPDWSGLTWFDTPAVLHITSATFSFADGHVVNHRWVNTPTLVLGAYEPYSGSPKSSYAQSLGLTESPDDLPYMANGYATLQWP